MKRIRKLMPPACWAGVPAMLVYCLTLSRGLFPGSSAIQVAAAAKLAPNVSPAHPVWSVWTTWIAHVPWTSLPCRLNLFSAICGALAVAVLGGLIERWILRAAWEPFLSDGYPLEEDDEADAPRRVPITLTPLPVAEESATARAAARLGGWTAALALAYSVPFWSGATRLHAESFDILFLLVVVGAAQRERMWPSLWRTLLLGVLCGWGIIEIPGFFVWALALFGLLILERLRRELPWERDVAAGVLVAAAAAGLLLLPLTGFGPDFLRQTPPLSPVIGKLVRANQDAVRDWLPPLNWCWLLLLTYVPMFASLVVARRALRNPTTETVCLCLAFCVTVLMCVLPTPVSPWKLTRQYTEPFILGSLAVAVTAGFLAACWRLAAAQPLVEAEAGGPVVLRPLNVSAGDDDDAFEGEPDDQAPRTVAWSAGARGFRLHPRLAYAISLLPAVLALVAAGFNLRAADGRNGLFADTLAREVLDRLGSREWIVTRGGPFDLHLRIAAQDRRRVLHLLPLTPSLIGDVRGEVKRMIGIDPVLSAQAPRLRNALGLGVPAFVREWLAGDPTAESRLLALDVPEVWTTAGRRPVPDGIGFTGVRDLSALRGKDLVGEHRELWQRLTPLLKARVPAESQVERFRLHLQREAGRTANNLGVLLEDLDRATDARAAYESAVRINPGNISAQVNLIALSTSAPSPRATSALAQAVSQFQAGGPLPPLIRVVETFGEIRRPKVLAEQARFWQRLGEPILGRELLARALRLAPGAKNAGLRQRLAEIDRQQGDADAARQAFLDVWHADTNATDALLGLAAVALEAGDWGVARDWIERARRAGATAAHLAIPLAVHAAATGRGDEAIEVLRDHTARNGGTIEAWALLAGLLLRRGALSEVEQRVLPAMERLGGRTDSILVGLVRARVLTAHQPPDYPGAHRCLLQVVRLRSDLPVLWDDLLRLDLASGDRQAGEADVAAALQAHPAHPLANSMRGTWLLERNDLGRAEDALRRSLAARPTVAAQNNLAETLRRQGRLGEAERAARDALEMDASNWAVWDTLGCVLMNQGRFDDAEKAFQQAASRAGNQTSPHASLQRIEELRRARTANPPASGAPGAE